MTDSRTAFENVTSVALQQGRIQPASVEVLQRIMQVESGGKSDAKNLKSTATGCFQFIKDTWCDQIIRHGAAYGRRDLAQKIRYDAASHSYVGVGLTPEERAKNLQTVLDARKEPTLATQMAVEFTHENEEALRKAGLPITPATIYLAHFLGKGDGKPCTDGAGAITLLRIAAEEPETPISNIFPATVLNQNAGVRFGKKAFKTFTASDLREWATMKMAPKDWQTETESARRQWKKSQGLPENTPEAEGDLSMVEILITSLIYMGGAVAALAGKLFESGTELASMGAQTAPLPVVSVPSASLPRLG